MNPRTLPVKRRPVSNGFFKRIHAVTRHRNQRVATTANPEDFENPDQSSRISRGFTIIFLIHVVAIALYFIHLNFLNDHSVATASPPATTETAANPKSRVQDAPIISPDDATCLVVAGDNYASIAAREGVDVEELRAINKNKPIAAGLTFKLPPKRIVAVDSPMVVALRKQTPSDADRGLVEPVEEEPAESTRPQVVHPKVVRETVNSKSNKDSAATKSNKESTSGKTSKETAVEEIMTPADQMFYVKPENTVEECMVLMTVKHIRHLPVCLDGKLLGLVSIGDAVKSLIGEKDALIEQLSNYIAGKYM